MSNRPLDYMKALTEEVTKLAEPPTPVLLYRILETQELIRERKKSKIQFSPPLLTCDGKPVIFPNTINVIQGQHGVHKSRFAEILTAALLSGHPQNHQLLGFRKDPSCNLALAYLDTERNLKDQFPAAIQSIHKLCGIDNSRDIDGFHFGSLINTPRLNRFEALELFLAHIRKSTDRDLVVILDVLSDCIQDFNSSTDSLQLIDMMNEMINNHYVTFIAIIHENPNSNKARGHLGTELSNKASTVLQIGFVETKEPAESPLIKISYFKCRSSERHPDMYVKYSSEEHTLVLADESEIQSIATNRQSKASVHEIKNAVRTFLKGSNQVGKSELIKSFAETFGCHPNTIRERLETLIREQTPFVDPETTTSKVLTEFKEGRIVWLQLSEPEPSQ